jgi:hypothetical protein
MRLTHTLPLIFAILAPSAFAAAPPGYVAFVVAGAPDPALPAFNAVPGATVNNVAIANPTDLLVIGQQYLYAVWSHDVTVKGTCVTSYALTQDIGGVKTTLDANTIKTYSCAPGTDWLWVTTGKAIPNSPGVATLTGTVKFGSKSIKFNVPVLISTTP